MVRFFEPGKGRKASRRWTGRVVAGAGSIAAHLLILLAVMSGRSAPPMLIQPEAVRLALVEAPRPEDPKKPPAPPAKASAAKRPAQRMVVRPTPVRVTTVEPIVAGQDPKPTPMAVLSDADLAGASTAGSGAGGGGTCNMVRLLQAALRKDEAVQAAMANAHRTPGVDGKAIHVWDGRWVRSPGEDGTGLAVIRQAIMVEIAFAPEACRANPMNGLVVISLNDAPGSARVALGTDQWRWTDLTLGPARG